MKYRNTRIKTNVPAISAAAYTTGKVVGGVQTLGPIGPTGARGRLKNVTVVDLANQKAALTLLIFSQVPTGFADGATPTISAADAKNLACKVDVATTDWVTVASQAVATVDVARSISGDDAGFFYLVAVVTGTPTYGTTSALVFTLGIEGD